MSARLNGLQCHYTLISTAFLCIISENIMANRLKKNNALMATKWIRKYTDMSALMPCVTTGHSHYSIHISTVQHFTEGGCECGSGNYLTSHDTYHLLQNHTIM